MNREDIDYYIDEYRYEVMDSIDTYDDLMAQFMVVRNTLKPNTIRMLENAMVDAERDGNNTLVNKISSLIEYSVSIKSLIEKVEDTNFVFECKHLTEKFKQ